MGGEGGELPLSALSPAEMTPADIAHLIYPYLSSYNKERQEAFARAQGGVRTADRPMTDMEELTGRWTPTINDP